MAETGSASPASTSVALRHELIVGGQRSGKSGRGEALARQWLAAAPAHQALCLATAQAGDEEMRQRIARHQADRAQRVPGMRTLEEPLDLVSALLQHSRPDTLVVVDCLTLWLTGLLMPIEAAQAQSPEAVAQATEALAAALAQASGPVVLVSNEIGLGVVPLGAQVRAFVDAQGRLNQRLAQVCERVTLMVAGLPLQVKGPPCL